MTSFFDVLSASILLNQPTSTLSASFVSVSIKNTGTTAGYTFVTITSPSGAMSNKDDLGLIAAGATTSFGDSGIIQVTGQYTIRSYTWDGVNQSTKVLNDTEFFTITAPSTTTTTTTTTTGTSILIAATTSPLSLTPAPPATPEPTLTSMSTSILTPTITPTCPAGFHYDSVQQICIADTVISPSAPAATFNLGILLPLLILYLVLS